MAEKHRKDQLKARTAYDWLVEIQKEYIKQFQADDIKIEGNDISMTKNALDFSIIYQSNNTRLMNPVTRKQLRTFFKNLEKDLNS